MFSFRTLTVRVFEIGLVVFKKFGLRKQTTLARLKSNFGFQDITVLLLNHSCFCFQREAAKNREIIMQSNDVLADGSDDVTGIISGDVTRIESDDVTRIESDDVTNQRTSDIIEHCLDVAKIDASENVFIMPHD